MPAQQKMVSNQTALVLFSGGMDSTVALFWALQHYPTVHALSIYYEQKHKNEIIAASRIINTMAPNTRFGCHDVMDLPRNIFTSGSSILPNGPPVATYKDVIEAVKMTASDPSYIPLRNAVFISIAAHYLLGRSPEGGVVVTGARGRAGPGGFADCTRTFHTYMETALQNGAGKPLRVISPLNELPELSRAGTIRYAMSLPGCMEALAHTLTCFQGFEPPCLHCLPCLRRAEAFDEVGIVDPLIARLRGRNS